MTLMMKAASTSCTIIAALLSALSAAAQAQTWASVARTPRDVVAVSAEWPSGVQMIARCTRGRDLDVVMTLGRPITQPHVAVALTVGDRESEDLRWRLSEDGGALFARRPTYVARSLYNHEDMVIEVTPDEGPPHRYELSAPAGEDALRGVLAACRRPTTPPSQDRALDAGAEWLRRPGGGDLARHYPPAAMADRTPGGAVIECRVSARGELEDCIVISEDPEGMGFGAATLALAPRFRMRPIRMNGHSHAEAVIRIPMTWRIQ